jgi:hypothetical protein
VILVSAVIRLESAVAVSAEQSCRYSSGSHHGLVRVDRRRCRAPRAVPPSARPKYLKKVIPHLNRLPYPSYRMQGAHRSRPMDSRDQPRVLKRNTSPRPKTARGNARPTAEHHDPAQISTHLASERAPGAQFVATQSPRPSCPWRGGSDRTTASIANSLSPPCKGGARGVDSAQATTKIANGLRFRRAGLDVYVLF